MIVEMTPNVVPSLAEELEHRVELAGASLEKFTGPGLSQARRDLLLATYVLGLTTPFYEGGPPAVHLEAVRTSLERVMPAGHAARAIEAVPEEYDERSSALLRSIEALGIRDGQAIFARCGVVPLKAGHR